MRRRMVPALAAIMLVGMLAAVTPGQSVTGYEMYGFGEIEVSTGPGMPACAGHASQSVGGNCGTSPTTTWQFTSLTVNGHGMLGDRLVNSGYNCAGDRSNVTTVGHTANFQLTWIFDCHKIGVGDGWGHIVGVFTNNPGQACLGGACTRGTFRFAGTFDGCDSHTDGPNADGCPGGIAKVPMNCTAVFQPSGFSGSGNPLTGTTITGVVFQGECTAASA